MYSTGRHLSPPRLFMHNGGSPSIRTSGRLALECGPVSYYGQGRDGVWHWFRSDKWTLQTPIGDWASRHLEVERIPVPSVPGTWHRIAVAVPSEGGAVGRTFATVGIDYDTG